MSDAQLVSAAQAALSSSGRGDDHVLAALAVSTRAPDTLASLLTGAPRPDKRRVVALSVRPPAEGEGGGGGGGSWGAHIHTLKAAAFGGLTPIDRRNLRRLARLEGGPADADGRQRAAGLAFGSLSGATREELLLPTPEARAFLLGALWWLRAKFPSGAPPLQLSGLSSIQLRGWAEDAKAACRLPTGEEEEREEDEGGGADGGWGEPGGGLDGGAGPLSRAGSLRKGAHQRPRLVSDAEAAALQSLLDSYKLDIGQAGALEERLTREAAALEAANVNALLQSDVDLAAVMHLLRLAESELEDTGQWLGVFTVKLAHSALLDRILLTTSQSTNDDRSDFSSHPLPLAPQSSDYRTDAIFILPVRGDMRAIEARSRTLQRQAANNAAVRAPLAALVAATAPAGRLEKELAGPVVGPSAGTALGAAGRLAERIAGLSEPPLPPGTASMRAVVETAASLGALRSGFVARGVGAARASIAAAHDAVAPAQPSATAQQGASQQQQPQQQPPRVADTSPAKRGLAELRPLVDALVRLDGPSSYPPLRSAFVAAAGGMLRRCGRDFGAAARAACKDGDKGGGGSGVVPPGAPRPLPPHALFGIGVHALLRAAGDVCGAGAELLWRPPEAPPVAAGDDEPQHGHHHHHHHHHRSHSHADNGHAAAANGHGGGGAAAAPPAGASAAPAPGGPTLASACAALFDALAPELASLAEWASKGDGGAAALAVAGAARRAGAAAGGGGGAAAPSAVHASASSSSLSGLAAASAAAAGAAPQPAAAAAAAQALSLAEAMDASLSRLVADRLAALRRVSPSSSSAFGGDAAPGASGGSAASSSSRLGGLISARAALIGGGAAGHHPPHEPLAEIVATAALVKRLHALAAEAPAPAESGADGAGDRKAARRAAAAAAQPASDGRREAADAACGSLVSCCLAAAKRAAAADPDHAAEITLRHAAILAAVAASCDAASPALISATSAAVASSLASYGDALLRRSPAFGPVLALADAIDSALGAGLSPDAAALRPGLTKGEARKALKDALGARRAERGIADAHSRVVKHFGGSGGGVPPTLVADAWAAARGLLLERYARLEGNVAAMYGDAVQPGAGELEELFKTV